MELLTMMKLFSQFDPVLIETPFARSEDGKISAGIAHGTGPQEAPYPSMNTTVQHTVSIFPPLNEYQHIAR